MLHADMSRRLDKEGITPTLIFAGAHKVDGNPFAPLPESVREDFQREVNQFYDLFVETVAAGRRGMSPAAIRGTEARVFIGADAVAAGLADSLGTFEEVLAELSRGPSGRSLSEPKGNVMEKQPGAPAAETTAAGITQEQHNTAVAAARTEATAAERARIAAIQSAAFPGQEALTAQLIAEGKSAGDAAMALNADYRAKGVHLANIKNMDAKVDGAQPAPSAPAGGQQQTAPKTDADWKAEFAAGKTGFATEADYLAFKRQESQGNVRLLSKAKAA
jgi:hypothetical protein